MPKGFLTALSFIFVFEMGNLFLDNFFYSYFPTGTRLGMRAKDALSRSEDDNFDILIFGDCYTLTGVIPSIVENKTRFACYNFSTHVPQTILASYCLLTNYLKEHTDRPKYVIISFAYRTYNIKKPDPSYLYDFRKGHDKLFLEEFGIRRFIKFSIPSLKHQSFFREVYNNPSYFLNYKLRRKSSLKSKLKETYSTRGYSKWRADKTYPGGATEESYRREPKFEVSTFSYKYIQKIIELAEENNIRVIYLNITSPRDWYGMFLKHGYLKPYDNLIALLKTRYPHVVFWDPQYMLNEESLYSSRHHLNAKGAKILSEFLSVKINEIEKITGEQLK